MIERPVTLRALCVIALSAALTGCAGFGGPVEDEPTPEQRRLSALELQSERLQQRLENANLVGVAAESSRFEQSLRELRGEIEQIKFAIESAKRRERQLYLDVDKRLSALEQSGARAASGGNSDVDDNSNAAPEAQAAYLAAFETLKGGQYGEASKQFAGFLKDHPGSVYADNAQYWLGETQYVQRKFDAASKAFNTLVDDYPNSPKVPDALLKIGYVAYEQKDNDAAREALTTIVEQHPDASVASLAKQRLDRMRSEGR